jgi:parvulin-like peptidyl-prolyl isomerase
MSLKVNEHLIPDWAIERQAEALFENVARSMQGKPREVIQLAALDMAKDRLIDQTLMADESKLRNYKIDPAEVNKGMKQWLRQNGGKKALEQGKNPLIKNQDDLRREITSQIQFNRLLEEESSCELVTEEEALKYYDSRPDLFSTEPLLTASHILRKASSEAEFEEAEKEVAILRARIEEGEDFVELVRKESDDSQNDGHLGQFGRGRMVPPFEKVAFGLEVGELSQPVRTQFGWHLLKLHERTESEVTPFEEVSEKVIEYLQERRRDKVFDEFLDGLKQKAEITEVSGI